MAKVCSKCGIYKDDSCFHKRRYKNGKVVLKSRCKKCRSEDDKERVNNIKHYWPSHYKVCSKCGIVRRLEDFPIRKESTSGRRKECKECKKQIDKNYVERNREKVLKRKKRYYEYNKSTILNKMKDYRQREDVKIRRNEKLREEYKTDERTRLKRKMRTIVAHKVKKENRGTFNLLGYDVDELIENLKSKFDGDNFRECLLSSKYHIDHIIPENSFSYNSPDDKDFKKCWSYRNLRLISEDENLQKGEYIDKDLVKWYNIEDLLPEGFYEGY
jgi:hypothetical protein